MVNGQWDGLKFFPGGAIPLLSLLTVEGSQESRFSSQLTKVLKTDEGKAMLARLGLESDSIGAHSARKGAATFACSGTTAGPSIAAVSHRAGWTMGDVRDRYLKFEAASDAYLGRIVVGLPVSSSKLTVLPPHFDDVPLESISRCFPSLYVCFLTCPYTHARHKRYLETHSSLQGTLNFALASVVASARRFRELLPAGHALWSSPLFSNRKLMDPLKAKLLLTSDRLRPTGIPPWIALQTELTGVKDGLTGLKDGLKELRVGMVDDIEKRLEENGVAAANITPGQLYEHMDKVALRLFLLLSCTLQTITAILGVRLPGAPPVPAAPVAVASQPSLHRLHSRGSRLSMFPPSFELPKMASLGTAWALWHLGHPDDGIPPLRHLQADDFPRVSDDRKRLSDWRRMMTALAEQLGDVYDPIALGEGALPCLPCPYRVLIIGIQPPNLRWPGISNLHSRALTWLRRRRSGRAQRLGRFLLP